MAPIGLPDWWEPRKQRWAAGSSWSARCDVVGVLISGSCGGGEVRPFQFGG